MTLAGGMTVGDANAFNGSFFVTQGQNVLLVQINYRLGPLGFLMHEEAVIPPPTNPHQAPLTQSRLLAAG